MDIITSIKPLLAVLVPLLVIPVLVSSSAKPNVREAWTFIAGTLMFLIVASMLPTVLAEKQIAMTLFKIAPGANIAFRVDALGMLFALVASSLYIITAMYSIGYMRGLNEHGQTRFVSYFALAISATIGAAFSANLITLYLFYEVLSLATYPLVTHHQDAKSKESGRRYLTFILGTSIGLVLPAMIWCYHVTGTLEFSGGGDFFRSIVQTFCHCAFAHVCLWVCKSRHHAVSFLASRCHGGTDPCFSPSPCSGRCKGGGVFHSPGNHGNFWP